jgi:putative ABC transport system permease protein
MRFALLALRNLTRNRRRTAISLAVVATGTVGLILTAGFIRFSFDGLAEAIIHGGLGHLEVAQQAATSGKEATLERSLSEGLVDWPEIQKAIEAQPYVLAAAPNLHLLGMASTAAGKSASFLGLGVDPARERRMGFDVKLRQGQPLADAAPAVGADTALLARGLAETLGVAPGDTVTLLAMAPGGMLNALDVRVAGIVTTGVAELDTRFLKLHLTSAQRLLETDRVSNLVVTLDERARTDAVRASLGALLASHQPPLAVTGWIERAPFYIQVRNLYVGIFWFLGSVIFVLVVLSTSNTLVMAVMERVREIGTLRALGTGGGEIGALIVWEALWLGLFGALFGDLVGLLAIAALNAAGLQMPPPPGAVNPIDLRLAYVPEAFAGAIALMLVVMVLAAIGPVLRATRLRVVEALAHV